jgi:hypothetical protein
MGATGKQTKGDFPMDRKLFWFVEFEARVWTAFGPFRSNFDRNLALSEVIRAKLESGDLSGAVVKVDLTGPDADLCGTAIKAAQAMPGWAAA